LASTVPAKHQGQDRLPPGVPWPDETRQLLSRCTFPPPGEPVVCAVSGGADSVAMLALACAAGCEAHALHIDHGLRSASSSEAAVVRSAAHRLGATSASLAINVPDGPDLEARARLARYDALPEGVLVAHTADDQAETLLLNLLRGTGLDGLAGMAPEGGGARKVRRPVLALRRAETAAFAGALGLPVVTDPSNFDPRFRRNRVRNEVLPLLAQVFERDPVPLLARTAQLVADDACLLSSLSGALDPLDTKALRAAPEPLAKRALRSWLRATAGEEQHPPSLGELERVWSVVTGEAKACQLAGGRRVSRRAGRLSLDAARFSNP